jgi:hypothetical protein
LVTISWSAATDGGSQILSYQVLLQKKDGTFSEQIDHCDGSLAQVIEETRCSVPKSLFVEDPYLFAWGESVSAKVIAENAVGSSVASVVGSGCVLLREPDAPLNLANEASATTSSQIGLTWQEGAENGGSDVIDYSLFYD